MTAPQPIRSIDVTGKHFTTDILLEIVGAFEVMHHGEVLEVRTDDFEAIDTDVRSWAHLTGHRLLSGEAVGGGYRYLIEKGDPVSLVEKMAIVITKDRPDDLAPPLSMGLAAALEGLDVAVFFRERAVRILRKGADPRPGILARFGRRRVGGESPQTVIRRLRDLGAGLYACATSMERLGLERGHLFLHDFVLAEDATLVALMADADIQLYA